MKVDIEKLFLDSLINSLPDHIFFKDTESRFLMINRALASRFGLSDPALALGRTDFDFFSDGHAQEARNDEIEVMRTGKPIIAKEEFETTHSGKSLWVLTTKLPLYDTEGSLIGTFGVSRNVTEIKQAQQELQESKQHLIEHQNLLEETVRRRTEELSAANSRMQKEVLERRIAEHSLRNSEERYRRLIEVNPTYIYTVTLQKGAPLMTEHGDGCLSVTGYTPEEYVDNPNLWIIMVHPEDRDLVKRFATEDLTQRNHQNQIEHRIIHKDGRLRWVRNTVVHHYNDDGELVRYDGLVEDITARKYADERNRENDRLRAIIKMADGVAGHYSRIVNQIESHISAITRRVEKDEVLSEHAASIEDAINMVSSLNNRLSSAARAYSQNSSTAETLENVNIRKAVSKSIKSIKRQLEKKNIEIKTFIPSDVAHVRANQEQLLDTFTNMLLNASDALPAGGTITVTASAKNILRSSHRWNQAARGGKYVIVRVADTGIGMDRQTQENVFDTFFSSHKDGALGLGLAIAQAAVKSWGGWIRLRSKPGHGTVFRVFIPVADEEQHVVEEVRPVTTLRGKTVLIAEDNHKVTEHITRSFQNEGMVVLTARTDAEAIDIFSRNMDKVALCIVDMVLGSSDWCKTVETIYELKPEANVIVMSGFSREFVRANLPVGAWSFLQKPFDSSALLELAHDIVTRDES